ncbi:MAG: tRNA (adenosine(37)-N6)-threonylcarbamoyltransferase complex ATPase subunit type 1 TsaE [Patescibacteria group bacterium]
MEYICKTEQETADLAKKVASGAKQGDIFALFGELGSGKTTFAKSFSSALGVRQVVTSPTYSIVKSYKIDKDGEIGKVYHLDCYRLSNSLEIETIGLEEILSDGDAVFLLEWPERVMEILPKDRLKCISFSYVDGDTRKITI